MNATKVDPVSTKNLLKAYEKTLALVTGVIKLDENFNVVDINDYICHILDYPRHILLAEQNFYQQFSVTADIESRLKQRNEILMQGDPWTAETAFINSSGETIWFTENISAVFDKHNRPCQYICILTDINAKKQLENFNSTVDKKIDLISKAREAAELANISKSEFLANMSHELRTPMHAILSFTHLSLKQFTSLPLDDKRSDKVHKFLSNIETSSQRLLLLLNNLLDLSKLESGKSDLQFKQYDLLSLTQQIVTEYSAKVLEKNIHLIVNKPSFSVVAIFDKNHILQVLSNLIANAIKFSPADATILVNFQATEIVLGKRATDTKKTAGILFSIEDQGVGIPEGELSLVFDKFIQSSKTKNDSGGTGLGLSICQEIISAHKGKLWAEHNSAGGAVFKFFLPDISQ